MQLINLLLYLVLITKINIANNFQTYLKEHVPFRIN